METNESVVAGAAERGGRSSRSTGVRRRRHDPLSRGGQHYPTAEASLRQNGVDQSVEPKPRSGLPVHISPPGMRRLRLALLQWGTFDIDLFHTKEKRRNFGALLVAVAEFPSPGDDSLQSLHGREVVWVESGDVGHDHLLRGKQAHLDVGRRPVLAFGC